MISHKGAVFTGILEGKRNKAYHDSAGVLTIGRGYTWASAIFRAWWQANRIGQVFSTGSRMSDAEIDAVWLRILNDEYGAAVFKFFGRTMPQNVFDGADSATFNMGIGSLKWRWARALNDNDFKQGAALLQTVGRTVTINGQKKVIQGLVNRRREEAELIEFGDYAIAGTKGTFEPPDPMADGVLIRRERGAAVRVLQSELSAAGFYEGNIDGIFGYGTEGAVIEFQRAYGLTIDGKAGPKTLDALKSHQKGMDAPKPAPVPSTPKQPPTLLAALLSAIGAAWKAYAERKRT